VAISDQQFHSERAKAIFSSLMFLFLAACSAQYTAPVSQRTTLPIALRAAPDKRGMVTSYHDDLGDATPTDIVSGPDGALWFTDSGNNVIGRITTSGKYTLQQVAGTSVSVGITEGADKNLWFTVDLEEGGIGRITTSGKVTLYKDVGGAYTQHIAPGPDGSLWFTESNGTVGERLKSGTIRHFSIGSSNAQSEGIVEGPDSNLWIAQTQVGSHFSNQVIRLSTRGEQKSYTVGYGPESICVGPDKALWFTERGANAIGRLTTSGKFVEYPTHKQYLDPFGIATGPDGALWFTDFGETHQIGRMTTSGKLTYYPLHRTLTSVSSITAGPDGAMWFTSSLGATIGRIATR
jgi:virginiamycin B lyase